MVVSTGIRVRARSGLVYTLPPHQLHPNCSLNESPMALTSAASLCFSAFAAASLSAASFKLSRAVCLPHSLCSLPIRTRAAQYVVPGVAGAGLWSPSLLLYSVCVDRLEDLAAEGALSQTNSARTRWPRPNWSNAVRTDSSPEQSDPTLITGPVAPHGQELLFK